MPKDSLSEALFELKERDRKLPSRRRGQAKPVRPKRGRPKAFDPFYLLNMLLVLLSIGMQVVAIVLYA